MPAPNAVNAHVQHPASRAIPTGELKKSVINAASDNCETILYSILTHSFRRVRREYPSSSMLEIPSRKP